MLIWGGTVTVRKELEHLSLRMKSSSLNLREDWPVPWPQFQALNKSLQNPFRPCAISDRLISVAPSSWGSANPWALLPRKAEQSWRCVPFSEPGTALAFAVSWDCSLQVITLASLFQVRVDDGLCLDSPVVTAGSYRKNPRIAGSWSRADRRSREHQEMLVSIAVPRGASLGLNRTCVWFVEMHQEVVGSTSVWVNFWRPEPNSVHFICKHHFLLAAIFVPPVPQSLPSPRYIFHITCLRRNWITLKPRLKNCRFPLEIPCCC